MALPEIDEADVQAVVEVLRSGRLALGPATEHFEQSMADFVGVRHAVAVSSGTAALHLIVAALEIGAGDEVIVPSFTFIASVNSFLFTGADPVFVDIDPETYNLDPRDVEAKVTDRTKAVMVVDAFGHPAEWDELTEIARRHDLKLIDDSCEALGSEYRSRRLGQLGDAATFAFYPNKQITTGEGGMIVTDDPELARLTRSLRNQGRGSMGAWLEHERLGYNYRLDEMSAALGATQLLKLERFMAARQRVADLYARHLGGLAGVRLPVVRDHVRISWFVYVITLDHGIDRDRVMDRLQAAGVPCRAYFTPVHLQPFMRRRFGLREGLLPVTESVAARTVSLPFHNRMSEEDVRRVASSLAEAIGA